MNRRQQHIASQLRRLVQEALVRGLADPRITGMITVTEARVTDDLRTAVIMVSVMPESAQAGTMNGLRHAAAHIQRLVSRQLPMHHPPRLEFQIDPSLKKMASVFSAIREGLESSESKAAGGDPAPGEAPAPDPPIA